MLSVLAFGEDSMPDVPIKCPHCHKSFKLTETLAAPLVEETRRKLEAEFEGKEEDLKEQRKAFAEEQRAADKARKDIDKEKALLAKQREQIDATVTEAVEVRTSAIERDAAKRAKAKFDEKLAEREAEKAELEEALEERDKKLAEAQKAQRETLRKQRELDEKIREVELTAEKKAAELVVPLIEKAQKDADEASQRAIAQRDKTITDLQVKLQEAIRKAEQGSPQTQGEVQEIKLESLLRARFPRDTIEPVPKGEYGGDVVQRVLSSTGAQAGTILWESKDTAKWTDGWLAKLREDQRASKAEIAVIVTRAMPKGIDTFNLIDGIWVTSVGCAIPVGMTLRQSLLEIASARSAMEGQHGKMEMVYQYLTGPRFRLRVQAIVEAFTDMQDELKKERTVITRQWSKREEQIDRVMESTVGMYGDLQGIAGKTLQEIEGLELKALATAPQANGKSR